MVRATGRPRCFSGGVWGAWYGGGSRRIRRRMMVDAGMFGADPRLARVVAAIESARLEHGEDPYYWGVAVLDVLDAMEQQAYYREKWAAEVAERLKQSGEGVFDAGQ